MSQTPCFAEAEPPFWAFEICVHSVGFDDITALGKTQTHRIQTKV